MSQVLLSGAVNGVMYGVLGASIALMFVVSRMINLAIGEFLMVGGVWSGWMHQAKGWSKWLSLVTVGAAAIAMMAAVERFILERQFKKHASPLQLVLLSLAIGLLIQGVTYGFVGVDLYSAPRLLAGPSIELFDARLGRHQALLGILGVVAGLALAAWLRLTLSGRKVVAAGDSPAGCDVIGMNVPRIRFAAFAAAAAAVVLFGLLSGDSLPMTYSTGLVYTIKGVLVAVLSGLKFADRAVVFGMGLGVFESLVARYISSSQQMVIVFGLLIGVLFLRRNFVPGSEGL